MNRSKSGHPARVLFVFVARLCTLLVLLASPTVASARQVADTKTIEFKLEAKFGARQTYSFNLSGAACITARIDSWTGLGSSGRSASLSLILNGANRTDYYARADSTSNRSFAMAYAVTRNDATRANPWVISVVNFAKTGAAAGKLIVDILPAQSLCQIKSS